MLTSPCFIHDPRRGHVEPQCGSLSVRSVAETFDTLLTFVRTRESRSAQAHCDGTATSPLSSSLLLRSALLPSFTCSCLLLRVDAGDCGVAVAGESYSANFFMCRQCFSFSLLFGRGSNSLAIVAESEKQTKQANKYRMSVRWCSSVGLKVVVRSFHFYRHPVAGGLFISCKPLNSNALSLVGGLPGKEGHKNRKRYLKVLFHRSWSREIAK